MSYLDIPRIHFSGSFSADPSTMNNDVANYSPGAVLNRLWNPMGKHWFFLKDCFVRIAIDGKGNPAPGDPVVGGKFETTDLPLQHARLVDLDPDFQQASQIWGAEIQLTLKSGTGTLKGKLQTCGLRDLWDSRSPGGLVSFASGFGGVYQSVLDNPTSTAIDTSPVLKELSKSPAIAIKFVLYAYNATPGSPDFTNGKIVGTIGPFGPADGEDLIPDLGVHFLQARCLRDPGSGAFGNAPFKLNPGKKKLTIDLGNCIPEVFPGGARKSFGNLTAMIVLPPGTSPVLLGKLDYTQTRYEMSAGIEELILTAAQVAQLQTNYLGLMISSPNPVFVKSEMPQGLYVDVTEKVFRLEPGDSTSFALVATEFGKPKSGVTLQLMLNQVGSTPFSGGTPPAGLTFPATVTTSAIGFASVTIVASDPGNPRGAVDGQLYQIGYYSGPPAASYLEGLVFVHVYDKFPAPAKPVYADVKPILDQYAQLYPYMKLMLDLSNIATIKSRAADILRTLQYPFDDPRYMPVTRDLSPSKSKVLVAWLKAGCP